MKIAVSGTHCTGKTTLVEELHLALPGYVTVAEPYCLADIEDVDLRDQVDENLREALCGSSGFGADPVEVTGAVSERVRQVLAYIGAARS